MDNPTSIFDGEGRYASRTRANREVVVFTTADLRSDASNNTASKTITVNGKMTSMIIDPSRVKSTSTTATSGSIEFRMDIEDSGGNGYLCFDQIAALDYRTSSNTPLRFEVAPVQTKAPPPRISATRSPSMRLRTQRVVETPSANLPLGTGFFAARRPSPSPRPQAHSTQTRENSESSSCASEIKYRKRE